MKVYVLIEYCCNHFVAIDTDKDRLLQVKGFASEIELNDSEYVICEFDLKEVK